MKDNHDWETRLMEIASRFDYPSTPAISRQLSHRISKVKPVGARPKLQAAALVVLLLVGMAVFNIPEVRAELARIFKIGAVQVLPSTPPAVDTAIPGQTPELTADFLVSLDELAGSTTLAGAQAATSFRIRLPAYPHDLGAPDRVYNASDGNMFLLVWLDSSDPDRASLSLFEITSESHMKKFDPPVIAETVVDGNFAIWVSGPYLLELRFGLYDMRRIVEGHTLIWEEDGVTYRLETSLPIEEAVRVAESLR